MAVVEPPAGVGVVFGMVTGEGVFASSAGAVVAVGVLD